MTGKNRRRGDNFEYRCIADYYNEGFGYVYKAWGSKGLQDIIAFKPMLTKEYGILSLVHMVQCKTNKYGFTKTQKDRDNSIKLAQAATTGGCRSVHMFMDTRLPKHPLVRRYTNYFDVPIPRETEKTIR